MVVNEESSVDTSMKLAITSFNNTTVTVTDIQDRWFLDLPPLLVDSKVHEKGHPLPLKSQQEMLSEH